MWADTPESRPGRLTLLVASWDGTSWTDHGRFDEPTRTIAPVLDAMIAVGGLTEFAAGNKARLLRTIGGEQQQAVLRLDDLIKDGDISANVALLPGDVLIIP